MTRAASFRRNVARLVAALVTLACALTTGALLGAAPEAVAASSYPVSLSRYDSALLAYMNDARVTRGLPPLRVTAGSTDVAHLWSCDMRSRSDLGHRPRLVRAMERHGSRGWTALGENVGSDLRTAPARSLFRAYMNSPAHRANILSANYRYVGIHTSLSARKRWNTLNFASTYSQAYGPARTTC